MAIYADRILHRDDHLLIVQKRAGELVVKGKGAVGKLPLLDYLKKDFPGLRAVHRLDFETSGIVVFARTKEAHDAIVDGGFAGWRKVYHTLVMGRMARDTGTIRTPLPARGAGTVPALTRFRVLERFANSSYVSCEIETGRHHQIRRHFASIRHPLALDDLYGHRKFNGLFRQELRFYRFFLHAGHLEMPHPVSGERIVVDAPLPDAFAAVLKRLRSL